MMEISKLIISVCVEVIAYAVFAYAFYDDRVGFAARFEGQDHHCASQILLPHVMLQDAEVWPC